MTPDETTREIKRDSFFAFLIILVISACIATCLCIYFQKPQCKDCKQKDAKIKELNKTMLKNNTRYMKDTSHKWCFRSR